MHAMQPETLCDNIDHSHDVLFQLICSSGLAIFKKARSQAKERPQLMYIL